MLVSTMHNRSMSESDGLLFLLDLLQRRHAALTNRRITSPIHRRASNSSSSARTSHRPLSKLLSKHPRRRFLKLHLRNDKHVTQIVLMLLQQLERAPRQPQASLLLRANCRSVSRLALLPARAARRRELQTIAPTRQQCIVSLLTRLRKFRDVNRRLSPVRQVFPDLVRGKHEYRRQHARERICRSAAAPFAPNDALCCAAQTCKADP